MDYNIYYPVQSGHPTLGRQHVGAYQIQQQPLAHSSGQLMLSPMPPINTRQTLPPNSPNQQHHIQQLHSPQQQHISHQHQQSTSQQQHPGYQQIQSPHPHGSPLSQSPHTHHHHHQQQQQQQHQHLQHHQHHNNSMQSSMSGPMVQSSGLSQRVLSQSPHHHGASMHMQHQQQQLHTQQQQQQQHHHQAQHQQQQTTNQMIRSQVGPSVVVHSQTVMHQSIHHQQGALNTSLNTAQVNIPSYSSNQRSSNHSQQHHQQPSLKQHATPSPSLHSQAHHGIERNSPASRSISQTEIRVFEFNRRLQNKPVTSYPHSPLPVSQDESIWWDKFVSEFFEDDATLTLRILDDEPIEYVLSRTLIPRYFESYFTGGVTEFSINLRNPKEIYNHQNVITLDCDQAFIITNNIVKHPLITSQQTMVVHTEGHLVLDFVTNSSENLTIKSWKFFIRCKREYIDRSIVTTKGVPNSFFTEPVTKHGFTKSTITYLKMCMVMQPMQELMQYQKFTKSDPKCCLRDYLYNRYNFKSFEENKTSTVIPTTTKRRKRKSTAGAASKKQTQQNVRLQQSNFNQQQTTLPTSNSPIQPEPTTSPNGDDIKSSIQETCSMSTNQTLENGHVSQEVETNSQVVIPEIYHNTETRVIPTVEPKKDNINIPLPAIIARSTQSPTAEKSTPELIKSEIPVATESDTTKTPPRDEESCNDDSSRPVSEEPSEKENNGASFNEEPPVNDITLQKETHLSVMSSIPEDREDGSKITLCDSIVTKLPPSVTNKIVVQTNGNTGKQNRRRSSERKETLREGLMRTSDFVIAMKDLKTDHPSLWRITTGNNLLQQFEPKTQNGVILYENTNQYAGWNPEIRKDYVGVDVRLTQHTRNQITVERLLLNFQNLEDAENFYDKHFLIYLQILISNALDPKFWESIENEPQHHDYFLTSRKIIEDIIKRHKSKISAKLKLSETAMKNFEKYPNLIIKPLDGEEKSTLCRACNTNTSTQVVTFGNRSYDLHSYKPVKVTSEPTKVDDKDQQNYMCDHCLDIVQLYSEVHHMGWKFFNIARNKVEQHRAKGKNINNILDECLSDERWVIKNFNERDMLWSKVDRI